VAATLFDGKKAVQTQAYSSEQRGGMTRAEVIISSESITDPQVRRPDILMALAQDAVNRHIKKVKPSGLVIYDADLVKEIPQDGWQLLGVPATSLADQEMNNIIVANLILLGQLIKKTGILSVEAVEKAIAANVPAKAKELNLKAFRRGLELSC
jgi:2-oxoglutarate ferredoxin oxidoreductase subunit gamma